MKYHASKSDLSVWFIQLSTYFYHTVIIYHFNVNIYIYIYIYIYIKFVMEDIYKFFCFSWYVLLCMCFYICLYVLICHTLSTLFRIFLYILYRIFADWNDIMSVYIYIYIYIYIYTHTHTQTQLGGGSKSIQTDAVKTHTGLSRHKWIINQTLILFKTAPLKFKTLIPVSFPLV